MSVQNLDIPVGIIKMTCSIEWKLPRFENVKRESYVNNLRKVGMKNKRFLISIHKKTLFYILDTLFFDYYSGFELESSGTFLWGDSFQI